MSKFEYAKLWLRLKWHSLKTIGRDYLRFVFVAGFVVGCFWGWTWVILSLFGWA